MRLFSAPPTTWWPSSANGCASRLITAPACRWPIGDSLAAINVGLESFRDSLVAQNASTIQVDWRPPAGRNRSMMAILARMKGGKSPEEAS
ncbi:MAG: hypothetical protein M9927_07730 [Anaerolineae bacterium]|nr:hypothetical protein [Anaerolineae bacterium]